MAYDATAPWMVQDQLRAVYKTGQTGNVNARFFVRYLDRLTVYVDGNNAHVTQGSVSGSIS